MVNQRWLWLTTIGILTITGWCLTYTPLKHMLVSWDYDIPNIWKVIKFHGSKPPTSYGPTKSYIINGILGL